MDGVVLESITANNDYTLRIEVVVNELEQQAQIVEIKRKTENIDLNILRDKDVQLRATGELKNYQITYLGLSMDEI